MKTLALLFSLFLSLTAAQAQNLEALLTGYMQVKDALVASSFKQANEKAQSLQKSLNAIDAEKLPAKEKAAFAKVSKEFNKANLALVSASNLEAQRKAFSDLSATLYRLLQSVPIGAKPVYRFYCPMKKDWWLSFEKEVKNPYYGAKMLTCGSLEETLQAPK